LSELSVLVEFTKPRGLVERRDCQAAPRVIGPGQTGSVTVEMPKRYNMYRVVSVRSEGSPDPFESLPAR
jgi:hypothetical protein